MKALYAIVVFAFALHTLVLAKEVTQEKKSQTYIQEFSGYSIT